MFSRMRRGWELTKKSWGVIRSHPGLAKLPLTGGAFAVVAALVLCLPGAALIATDSTGGLIGGIALVAIGAYLASFAVIYFNVILAAAADQALQGHRPNVAAARRVARGRIVVIAEWALVSAIVSTLLSIVRDRGGVAGGIGAAIGGAIWSLVTFLVVPVLAFEGIGPIQAIKRSAHLFRQRWGQQVTGNIAIGGIAGLGILLGIVLVVVGVAIVATSSATGAVLGGALLAVGLVVAIAAAVFAGATRGVFGVALYRFVAEDKALAPFTTADLEGAARLK